MSEEIFLIGPDPTENDLNISTISWQNGFQEVFSFVVKSESGGIRPLVISGKMPIFTTEENAVKWIMSGDTV